MVMSRPVSRENVPGTATSPSSTARRITRPAIGDDEPGLAQVVPRLLQAGARLLELRLRRLRGSPGPRRTRSAPARPPRARSGWVRAGCSSLRAAPGCACAWSRLALACSSVACVDDDERPAPGPPPPGTAPGRSGSGTDPCVTRSPSRTAIWMMRPVMSALMSTDVLASILPLAVTALTRSRRVDLLHPDLGAACFFLWIR